MSQRASSMRRLPTVVTIKSMPLEALTSIPTKVRCLSLAVSPDLLVLSRPGSLTGDSV